ncbi:MAG: DUF3486 family protein [Panacagrimonas sp.]
MPKKSSIATLDPAVRESVDQLLKLGRLTLDQVIDQLRAAFPGAEIPSRSALGRYSQRFDEIGKRMRESREVAKVWADRLGNEPQGDIGKLVMELLRTMAFDVTLEMQEPDDEGKVQIDPKSINTLALAMQRLEAAGKWNLQREQAMRESLVTEVETKLKSAPRKLDAESLALVRQAIRGDA